MLSLKTKLGQKIIDLRQMKKLSRSELSFLSTVNYTTLMNIENGKTYPRLETLQKLAMILEVSLKELFDESKSR